MNKNIRIVVIAVIVLSTFAGGSASVPTEEWNRTFAGRGHEEAYSVVQTVDGGFLIAGRVLPFGDNGSYALLIKADTNGSEQWNRIFGKEYYNQAWSVRQTTDGGCILAGGASEKGSNNAWLIKIDINGFEQWNRTFGGYNSVANSVQQTRDGGYILTGTTFRYGRDEVMLIKTDILGNVQWERIFDVKGSAVAGSVQQTIDGGYILAGKAWSQETTWYGRYISNFDAWLIKTDMNGSQQWKKTFGEKKEYSVGVGMSNGPFTAQQTSDGGFILVGSMFWDEENSDPVWLIKADANGNQQWKKKLGPGWIYSVHQTRDDGFILAGGTSYNADGKTWLIRTDANGNEQWNSSFARSINGIINSIKSTRDGGYILAGIGLTGPFGFGDSNALLIKVSKEPQQAARFPTSGQTEKVSGFKIVQVIIILSVVYLSGRKRR